MLAVIEIGICVMFASSILALIAARFLKIGSDADALEEKLLKERH